MLKAKIEDIRITVRINEEEERYSFLMVAPEGQEVPVNSYLPGWRNITPSPMPENEAELLFPMVFDKTDVFESMVTLYGQDLACRLMSAVDEFRGEKTVLQFRKK